jgi:hypothetical protein
MYCIHGKTGVIWGACVVHGKNGSHLGVFRCFVHNSSLRCSTQLVRAPSADVPHYFGVDHPR